MQHTLMNISPDNTNINGLWIGTKLSQVELLTLYSFIRNGHTFTLWAYDPIENELPEGVTVKDASQIIPREKVFCYKNTNQFGHGKGSYAGFSDIFRYKLLYEFGGWWVDMDVTCLKPFDFEEPYVFRPHHDFPMVGNIMKCPKHSELMNLCFIEATEKMNADNTDWHLPIAILNSYVHKLGLSGYIRNISNKDSWNYIRKLLIKEVPVPEEWYVIHWVNEEWRRNKVDKNLFHRKSTLGKLCQKYFPDCERILTNFSFGKRIKFSYLSSAKEQILSRF